MQGKMLLQRPEVPWLPMPNDESGEGIADFIGERTARAVWGSLDDVRVVTCWAER